VVYITERDEFVLRSQQLLDLVGSGVVRPELGGEYRLGEHFSCSSPRLGNLTRRHCCCHTKPKSPFSSCRLGLLDLVGSGVVRPELGGEYRLGEVARAQDDLATQKTTGVGRTSLTFFLLKSKTRKLDTAPLLLPYETKVPFVQEEVMRITSTKGCHAVLSGVGEATFAQDLACTRRSHPCFFAISAFFGVDTVPITVAPRCLHICTSIPSLHRQRASWSYRDRYRRNKALRSCSRA
jgi:NADPH:quinone reductase-like Zn-dependent oxidoreductase